MKSKILIVGSFLIVAGFLVNAGRDRRPTSSFVANAGSMETVPAAPSTPAPVEITMLYSPEKQDWIEAVAIEFRRIEPGIKLQLRPMETLEAVGAIEAGREHPTIWSPTDSASLELLRRRWRSAHHADPFATDPELQPAPVALSPLVFVVWRDRADVLSAKRPLSWHTIRRVITAPRGWQSVGGRQDWGALKLGHADPTKSSSGLNALLLMAHEYFGRQQSVSASDVTRPAFQGFASQIERAVPDAALTTSEFMVDLVRYGPSRFDVGVVFENAAISEIENAEGRWGPLRVVYPSPTIWSDHPLAVLSTEWVSAEQRAAARRWVTYLRSRTVQRTALAFGFRPADVGVPIVSSDLRNPFPRLSGYGVKVDLPSSATAPSPELIEHLTELGQKVRKQPRATSGH